MAKLKWIIALIIITLIACSGVSAEDKGQAQKNRVAEPEQKAIRHIIYITVNGLTAGRIEKAYTPNINGLAAAGVKSEAIGVLPANIQTFTASLLTGADPAVHGSMKPGQRVMTVTLPEIAVKYGRSAVVIAPEGSLPKDFIRKDPNQNGVAFAEVRKNSTEEVINRAIDIFSQNRPFFVGVILPGVNQDLAKQGREKDISTEINTVDGQIGRLLTTLRSHGVYENSLIVVTGFSAGKGSAGSGINTAELLAPVIMSGPGLNSGAVLPPIKVTDISPTVAMLAGLKMPPASSGLVLWNALRSGTGFHEQNLLLKRIKDLSDENINSHGQIYRLQEEKRLVRVEKESVDREKLKIQQTIKAKNGEISFLKLKINFLKALGGIIVLALGIGYIVEYFYLRKKFLMF